MHEAGKKSDCGTDPIRGIIGRHPRERVELGDVLIHAKEVGRVKFAFQLFEPIVLACPVSSTNPVGWLICGEVVYVDSFLDERLNGKPSLTCWR